ncbi:hypothetical protein [Segatella bryantii]|uniref:Outer membrane lipoprotein-sorting protein n=1 Tax=Segatella bryantii TaxID=77095 RepID=A0ABX4EHJ4_SEGBR|nr:hypothetical protein [Segatella bryantii]MDR4931603.1 hypothetical protein [Segatella bryantii]OYP55490.1 hypothetical protein CIK91_06435 [Segatella bryantii]UKK75232.1 hypothetical protein L6471_01830 [Segatella bryantii]UKK81893.1 hypothetical protein L6474_12265 [Segatella bryantii]
MNISIKKNTFLAFMLAFPMLINAQSVKELCEHNVEKLGGKVAIERVKTLRITQIGTSNGLNMPTTTVILPGKAYYQKVRTSMGIFTTCVYDNKGWSYSSAQPTKVTDLPSNMARSLIIDSKFYGPLCDYYINGSNSDVKSIAKEGETTIDREKCFKLGVTYKSGYKATVYLSALDYMIRKVESPVGIFKYRNYKKVDQVMIPRYIEVTNNRGTIISVVSSIKVNSKVKNDMFARP